MGRVTPFGMVGVLLAVGLAGCGEGENAGDRSERDQAQLALEEAARQAQRQAATAHAVPVTQVLDLGDGVTMKLVLIPAGTFRMGSPTEMHWVESDERPQHEVTINWPFYLGATEVTQGQWHAVMTFLSRGAPPKRGDVPAWKSWVAATAFCKTLSARAGRAVRLPTEAQWEYACRAGTTSEFSHGRGRAKLGEYAWYRNNAWDLGNRYAHPVARKKPNAWGLYDMYGNAPEWCRDWYGRRQYSSGDKVDPTGPARGGRRVVRGGGFATRDWKCASGNRFSNSPLFGGGGFRVVVELDSRAE